MTTKIGAEGMQLREPVTALIADSAEDFANAVGEVYESIERPAEIARSARDHVDRKVG